jgi:hypothetical protein
MMCHTAALTQSQEEEKIRDFAGLGRKSNGSGFIGFLITCISPIGDMCFGKDRVFNLPWGNW